MWDFDSPEQFHLKNSLSGDSVPVTLSAVFTETLEVVPMPSVDSEVCPLSRVTGAMCPDRHNSDEFLKMFCLFFFCTLRYSFHLHYIGMKAKVSQTGNIFRSVCLHTNKDN